MEARGISAPTRGSCTKSSHITQECVNSSPAALGKRQRHAQCLDGSVGPGDPPRPSRGNPPPVRRSAVPGLDRQEAGHREGQGETERQTESSETQTKSEDQLDPCSLPKTHILTPKCTHGSTPQEILITGTNSPQEHTRRLTPSAQVCVLPAVSRAACEDPSLSTNLEGRSDLARFLPPSSHFPHSFPVLAAQGSPGSRSTDPGSWNEHPISRIERSPEELCKMKDFLGRREREQGSLLGKKPGHSGQCLVVFPVCKP
ncbi:uncharacterized protein LOC109450436 isoform X2 [Rhinolophus sinicus]|uniref:uncharacterized protein LOC109450436 isoform X2 n=1 Tax=Rhinolophus sinicus TaxID=89399 RepID=UPI003D7A1F9F